MHQRKGKIILIYFLLLITVGSVNNIYLNDFKFDKIKNINISGLKEINNQILKQEIISLNLENIFLLKEKEIRSLIEKNTLIENYKIFKKYPSTLNIKVKETDFLAKINKSGKMYLIGSNGKLSKIDFSDESLPFIFGKPEISEFLKFKKIIDASEIQYNEIKSLYFFQSKRWDIVLKNNTLIKLSKNFTREALNNALLFLNNNQFKDIKTIDARVKNQIIINE